MSTARRTQSFFRALPAYLGGKRRFCQLLFSILAEQLPQADWRNSLLLDPFSGGGAVALFAKAQGFQVVASDLAERAAVVSRALIANSSVRLRFDNVLDLFAEPGADYPGVAAMHSPSVFAPYQAAWLDRALARRTGEPNRRAAFSSCSSSSSPSAVSRCRCCAERTLVLPGPAITTV